MKRVNDVFKLRVLACVRWRYLVVFCGFEIELGVVWGGLGCFWGGLGSFNGPL